jgi:hypothetical protein
VFLVAYDFSYVTSKKSVVKGTDCVKTVANGWDELAVAFLSCDFGHGSVVDATDRKATGHGFNNVIGAWWVKVSKEKYVGGP